MIEEVQEDIKHREEEEEDSGSIQEVPLHMNGAHVR